MHCASVTAARDREARVKATVRRRAGGLGTRCPFMHGGQARDLNDMLEETREGWQCDSAIAPFRASVAGRGVSGERRVVVVVVKGRIRFARHGASIAETLKTLIATPFTRLPTHPSSSSSLRDSTTPMHVSAWVRQREVRARLATGGRTPVDAMRFPSRPYSGQSLCGTASNNTKKSTHA